jgi:hypothetical protein
VLGVLVALAAFPRPGSAQMREYVYMGDRLLAIEGPAITVQFAASASTFTETQNAQVAVTIAVPGGGNHGGVSFHYTLFDGSAVAGQDYVGTHGQPVLVTVPPGPSGTRQIEIPIINDTIFEEDETFTLQLSNPTGAVLGSPVTHVVTILDDEPTVELVLAGSPVTEGPAVVQPVDVRLTLRHNIPATSSRVDFTFATSDGTAHAPEDYTATSGSGFFAQGTPHGTVLTGANRILIPIGNDEIDEPDQSFFVDLTGVTGGALGLSRHVVTIVDEDPTAALSITDATATEGETGLGLTTLAVTLSRPSEFPVSVSYQTANGTALDRGRDFWSRGPTVLRFPLRSTSLSLRVPVVGDRVAEPAESFFVDLSGAQNAVIADERGEVSITDTDQSGLAVGHLSTSEGASVRVTVTLPSAPAQAVTVSYQTVPGTATPGADYTHVSGTLTITPPASSASFDVKSFADTEWENRETFRVQLSGSSGPPIAYPEATVTVVDPSRGSDFNGDSATDLLWRHETAGQLALWYMNGVQLSSGSATNPATFALNWKVVGTGSFPPTAGWDLLWWDSTTGNFQIWQMVQANRVNVSGTTPAGVPDLRWQPVATGDFNADGKTDIVWRNTASGEIVVWLMNGNTLLSGTFTTPRQTDVAWEIQGTGDFNADGKTDLVWRHVSSGELVVWLMNGTDIIDPGGGQFMNPEAFADSGWQLRVVRDFDLDGQPDLLWRHSLSGQSAVWWMEGYVLKYGELGTPLADTRWKLVGPR